MNSSAYSKIPQETLESDPIIGDPRVLMIRHAETVANANRFFLGQRNIELTEKGEEQSRRAVAGLVSWEPDRIITSPMDRCQLKIAEPAAEALGVELIVDDRIKEFDFGPLEGMTTQQIMAAGLPMPWGEFSEEWPPVEGGEAMDNFFERIEAACRDLEAYEGKTAVVAHGGVIRGFLHAWTGLATEDFWKVIVSNVDSSIFRIHPGYAVLERLGLVPEHLENYR